MCAGTGVAGDGRRVRRWGGLGPSGGLAAACGGCGKDAADGEHRRAAGCPIAVLGAGEPRDPGHGERSGDVEVQPQAQEMLGGVDPQALRPDDPVRPAPLPTALRPGNSAPVACSARPQHRCLPRRHGYRWDRAWLISGFTRWLARASLLAPRCRHRWPACSWLGFTHSSFGIIVPMTAVALAARVTAGLPDLLRPPAAGPRPQAAKTPHRAGRRCWRPARPETPGTSCQFHDPPASWTR